MDSIVLYGGLDYGSPDYWTPLKGMRREVVTIADRMKRANKPVCVLMQEEGTAESFFALSGKSPDIIHIATHSFSETKESAAKVQALRHADAMSRSGLVFSRGNKGWLQGTPDEHEGIVTAADIAKMQLDTQMVVLSACETGNGSVSNGFMASDGIYGLQRGFKKAGVHSMVISVWTLGDEEGNAFMQLFYTMLIAGMTRRKAFYEAKRRVREMNQDYPEAWAGLIMVD
jgi:CHAT domain-containing protein